MRGQKASSSTLMIAAIMIFSTFSLSAISSIGIKNVNAQQLADQVFSIKSSPYGISMAEWSAKWWQRTLSIPMAVNPVNDDTGAYCSTNQSGPIWFLGGNFGGKTERNCTVPSGKAILFPIINVECTYKDSEEAKSEQDLRNCAKADQDKVTNLDVTIDGTKLENLRSYRIQSPLFNVTLPNDNVIGKTPGATQGISDGYWILLKPLSPGKHEIKFVGLLVDFTTTGSTNFLTDNTYHLTIE